MITSSVTWCPKCGRPIVFTHLSSMSNKNVNRELLKLVEEHQRNKCIDCKFDFASCKGIPEFGNCVGKDNVVKCSSFRKIHGQKMVKNAAFGDKSEKSQEAVDGDGS